MFWSKIFYLFVVGSLVILFWWEKYEAGTLQSLSELKITKDIDMPRRPRHRQEIVIMSLGGERLTFLSCPQNFPD